MENAKAKALPYKKLLGEAYQKLGSVMLCQQAKGGFKVREKIPLQDKELAELTGKQEGWIRDAITRLTLADEYHKTHKIAAFFFSRWLKGVEEILKGARA